MATKTKNNKTSKFQKYCFVPDCGHNDKKNPDVTFVRIRDDLKGLWCEALGRSCPKRVLYCCENHIDLESDTENYWFWRSMGGYLILKQSAKLKNVKFVSDILERSVNKCDGILEDMNCDSMSDPLALDSFTMSVNTNCTGTDVKVQRKRISKASRIIMDVDTEALNDIEIKPDPDKLEDPISDIQTNDLDINIDLMEPIIEIIEPNKQNDSLECNICSKRFNHHLLLESHMLRHTNERPYVCVVCNKAFREFKELQIHSTTHTTERPYQCNVCNKSFAQSNYLRKHRSIHSVESPYSCELCHKSYSRKDSLYKHALTHTNDRSHICQICQKGFNRKDGLKQHLRIHTNDRPYACNICESAFTQRTSLKQHLRSHMRGDSRYVCEICFKEFSLSHSLKNHLRSHENRKPFVCDVCNQGFSLRNSLVYHIRTHTAEKPYVCSVCNKEFKQKFNLQQHQCIHSNT